MVPKTPAMTTVTSSYMPLTARLNAIF